MKSIVLTHTLVLSASLLAYTHLYAQSSKGMQDTSGITVVEDNRIPKLLSTYIETQPEGVPGSRIQIFFTAKKSMALEVKTTFMEKFPDYVVLMDYDPPNFKVLAGAFRTKLQAEKLLELVREEFPGSFLVTDNIPLAELYTKD